jgi:mono/diheme cytochrome c family protein
MASVCHRRSRMTRRLKHLAGVLLTCRLVSSQGSEPGPQPKTTPEDLVDGQRVFGTQCSYCQGPKGEGGQSAVLKVPRLPHAPDDQALFRVIREGIPGTRMPASALTTRQIWQVAAYVRELGRVAGSKPKGDPRRGQQIFSTKGGCAKCHTIGGHGGAIGPDLTDIGDRRDEGELRWIVCDVKKYFQDLPVRNLLWIEVPLHDKDIKHECAGRSCSVRGFRIRYLRGGGASTAITS